MAKHKWLVRMPEHANNIWRVQVTGHTNNIWRVVIVLLFLLLAIWALTLSHLELVIAHSEPWLWLTDALIEVGPELAGIVIGVVTIDYLNERRQDEQLKEQLIVQMGSRHPDVTDTAIRTLMARGWLYDGTLEGALLMHANLSEAGLWRANLSRALLVGANLSGAYVPGANLAKANLSEADLTEAALMRANLKGANLSKTNLNGIKNWTVEQLEEAETLEGAIMPDGVQLFMEETEWNQRIEGPTFEEWKAGYLGTARREENVEPRSDDAGDAEQTEGA